VKIGYFEEVDMSTDESYDHVNYEAREKVICSDQDEIGWCLGKVKQYAKEHGLLMYVIRKKGFFWMTDMYVPTGKRVAIVYPGGRTQLGCCYENRRLK